MKIDVRKPTEEEIATFANYPIWECEPSEFPWSYNSTEQCLVLEGEVTIVTEEGETTFGPGDLVTVPSGMSSTRKVTNAVKQHYTFKD
ncbi:MAG: cupin domain-containing protein [Candidatus Marinimicrobia bacterium]|nr:cupin domain-containing protein [Candidatus Neomarinimicrobiota bacterium]